jgi:hypothetical protein
VIPQLRQVWDTSQDLAADSAGVAEFPDGLWTRLPLLRYAKSWKGVASTAGCS